MANEKISEMPIAGTVDGTEQIPLVQRGNNVQIAITDLFGRIPSDDGTYAGGIAAINDAGTKAIAYFTDDAGTAIYLVAGPKSLAASNDTGIAYLFSANTTGSHTSGWVGVTAGNTVDGDSGGAEIHSGNTTGAGNSSNTLVYTGQADGTGNTGSVFVQSGISAAGNSGNITLQTGTAGGTRGNIILDAPNISLPFTSLGGSGGIGRGNDGENEIEFFTDTAGTGIYVYSGQQDWTSNSSSTGFAYIFSGNVTGSNATTGWTGVGSGNTVDGNSGGGELYSGRTSGSGTSGEVDVHTGHATGSGNSGIAYLYSGNASGGNSGDVSIYTGTATSVYTASAVHFADGVHLTSTSGFGEQTVLSFSFWFKMAKLAPATNADFDFFTIPIESGADAGGVGFTGNDFWAPTNQFYAYWIDSTDVNWISWGEPPDQFNRFVNGQWHHLLGVVDGTSQTVTMYLDDVKLDLPVRANADPPVTYDFRGLMTVPLQVGPEQALDMADVWIAPGVNLLVDGDIPEATRRQFISASGQPVNPSGFPSAAVLFSGDHTTFATNQGTGGSFTLTGSLTDAATSPTQPKRGNIILDAPTVTSSPGNDMFLQSGDGASVPSGGASISTGTVTGTGDSGVAAFASGDTDIGRSGETVILTGTVHTAGNSGNVVISTGDTAAGFSGDIGLRTGAVYTASAVHFAEGVNLVSASGFGKPRVASFSFWFNMPSYDGTPHNQDFSFFKVGNHDNSDYGAVSFTGTDDWTSPGLFNAYFPDQTDTKYLNFGHISASTDLYNGQWHHLLGVVSGELGLITIYIDDQLLGPPTYVTDYNWTAPLNLDWQGVMTISVQPGSGQEFDMADFWCAPGISLLNGGGTIDEAIRRQFISANLQPVNPSSFQPSAVLLSGNSTTFGTNQGAGGSFTLTGSLTNAATSPSTATRGNIILNAPAVLQGFATFGPDPANQGVYGITANGLNIMATDDGDVGIGAWLFSADGTTKDSQNCGVGTGNASGGHGSGPAWLYSGNITDGSGHSGIVFVESGDVVDGVSGDIQIVTGHASGSGSRGNILLDANNITGAPNAFFELCSLGTGGVDLFTNGVTGSDTSGGVGVGTGSTETGRSGDVQVYTGNSTGGDSGNVSIGTGGADSGTRGNIILDAPTVFLANAAGCTVQSPDQLSLEGGADGGATLFTSDETGSTSSGGISVGTGNTANANSGLVYIYSGDSSSQNSGDITLSTGNASGTRGNIILDAPFVTSPSGRDLEFVTQDQTGSANSDRIDLYTGNTTGAFNTGGASLGTGSAAAGSSGEVSIFTGNAAGAGKSVGNITIVPGTASGGAGQGSIILDAATINFPNSAPVFTFGDAAGIGAYFTTGYTGNDSGAFGIQTNDIRTSTGSSGGLYFGTGGAGASGGNSGGVSIYTSDATSGTGGDILISCGSGTDAAHSGYILLQSGKSVTVNLVGGANLVIFGLPTSSAGLPSGAVWRDAAAGNVLKMVP